MEKLAALPVRLFFALTGALPMAALAVSLSLTWLHPGGFGDPGWVRAAVTLVLLEIVLLHSGAFMAVGPTVCPRLWQRLLWFLGFGLAYGIGIVFYVRWTGSTYVLWVVLGVLASRLLFQALLRDRRSTILALYRSVIGIFVILPTGLLTIFPWPELGLDEALRTATFGGDRDDLLTNGPQRFLAWGIAYFGLMAAVEWLMGWRMIDWTQAQVDETWEKLGR